MRIANIEKTLSLTNEGHLSLFFTGTGSAFSKNNYQTNMLIIKGQDHLLVDCGTSCSRALVSYGSSLENISNFLVTHSHADHTGGLEEAAFQARYKTKRPLSIYLTEEYSSILWENTLKGGLAYGEDSDGPNLTLNDYFRVCHPEELKGAPRPAWKLSCGGMNLVIFRTKHLTDLKETWDNSAHSFGLLIDEKVLFTGDTKFDPELLDWLLKDYPGIEHIFHDCQFFKGGVHASYEELLTLPEDIKKKIHLCHYGDSFTKYNAEKDGFAEFAKQGVYYNF